MKIGMDEVYRQLISESINDKGLFKAVFLAGVPFGGKSYVITRVTDGAVKPTVVNTDRAIEFFQETVGVDAENLPKEWQDKSKKMTVETLYHAVNGMLPLIIDGTSSNVSNLLTRKGILESMGYDTMMVFVDTGLETALKRAESNERGRGVPEEFIRKVYDSNQENKSYFTDEVFPNRILTVDNSEGVLDDAVILSAYKAMNKFWSSDVRNPLGRRTLNVMKSDPAKYRYLTDGIVDGEVLKKKIDGWYRR